MFSIKATLTLRDKLTKEISKSADSVKRLGNNFKKLGQDAGKTGRNIRQRFKRSFAAVADSAKVAFDKMKRGLRKIGSRLGKLGGGFKRSLRNISFFGIGAAAAIGLFADRYSKRADEVEKTSLKLGVGIEALQELRFAADRAGVAASSLDNGIKFLQKNLGELQDGTAEQVDAFRDLGLSFEDFQGLSPDKALIKAVTALGKMEDQAKKTQTAMALFGKAGTELISLSEEDIPALIKRARELGLSVTRTAAKGAAAFRNSLTDLGGAVTGLSNSLGAKLLPVLRPTVDKLTQFIVKNRESISSAIATVVDTLASSFKNLLSFISDPNKIREFGNAIADGFVRAKNIVVELLSGITELLKRLGVLERTASERAAKARNSFTSGAVNQVNGLADAVAPLTDAQVLELQERDGTFTSAGELIEISKQIRDRDASFANVLNQLLTATIDQTTVIKDQQRPASSPVIVNQARNTQPTLAYTSPVQIQ